MANTFIASAKIPSIGPKLKEKLIAHRIITAADINSNVRSIDGFGDSKSQILLNWQRGVHDSFINTRPTVLSDEELSIIKSKYLKLHQDNNTLYETAENRKQTLEQELQLVEIRLKQLTHVSLGAYLSSIFDGRKGVSFLIMLALVLMQCVLGISTGTASIAASLPTPTLTPTYTLTSTSTLTFTVTSTSTITNTPTITFTPTITTTSTDTFTPQPTLPSSVATCIPQNTERQTAQVVAIIDGDTIDVSINNQIYRVRYIGINTPERNEFFYNQATSFNQTLVYGKKVTLIKDNSDVDQFDRLLRYVVVDDLFVNYELVREGYALATAYPPDTACSSVFTSTQNQAKSGQFGFWMPTSTPYIAAAGSGGGNGNCDASYPGVCIPPAPPDLDCKDVPYKRFQVLSPDPHGFDRDGDGIGCES